MTRMIDKNTTNGMLSSSPTTTATRDKNKKKIGIFVEQGHRQSPTFHQSPQSHSKKQSSSSCCIVEDCESTVTLKVRCRRGHLFAILPVLAVLSVSANLNLIYYWHNNSNSKNHNQDTSQSQQQQIGSSSSGRNDGNGAATAGAAGVGSFASLLQDFFAGSSMAKVDNEQQKRKNQLSGGTSAAGSTGSTSTSQQQRRIQQGAAVAVARAGTTSAKKKTSVMMRRRVAAAAPPKIPPRHESVRPNNATFSACLLIKDDNEILPEWLAYHYHVLKLRSLIVAVDPLSVESPSKILQKWRLVTDLQVLEWSDDNYMPAEFLKRGVPPRQYMQKRENFVDHNLTDAALLEISNHRYRQRVFLAECMKRHRKLGNSWVVHIDTDEYVVASKLLRQMKPDYLTIPSMDEPGSVLSLIQQTVSKTSDLVSYPCISMLRVLFGSVESMRRDRDVDVPEGFNSKSFETLRWRYHALPHNMTLHGNPKVILDVAAIPPKYFPDVTFSIHRPVPAYCHKNKDLTFTNFRKQPIAVNHYLGSWERYSGRQDRRRSRAVYDAKANQRRGKDDGVRLWLKGFVRTMGHDTAAKLLGADYLAVTTANSVNSTFVESPAAAVASASGISSE